VKVLLCVDRSDASKKAVQFLADLVAPRGTKDTLTLLHVAEFLPEFVLSDHPEPGLTSRSLAERWAAKAQAEGEKVLEQARELCIASGVVAGQVQTKLALKDCLPESKKVAAALAIIEEMQNGDYDTICLGRRGASELALSFIGGVAEKVIREARGKHVILVD
jgi:nucleotide-binding universal stress UspA family protein